MSISSLPDELNRWYEVNCDNGDLAWSNLAKKAKVSISQLCKIAKGTVAKPKYHTAKAVLIALYPDDHTAVHQYLVEHYPNHQVPLKSLSDVKRRDIDDALRRLLKDQLTFRLFKLAISDAYTPARLNEEFGSHDVEPRLRALQQADIVEITESGAIRRTAAYMETATVDFNELADEFHHAIDILTAKKMIAKISDFEIDQLFNALMFYHESFTPEALQEMSKDIKAFMDDFYQKYSDEKYRGDIPAFLNIASGRFDSK